MSPPGLDETDPSIIRLRSEELRLKEEIRLETQIEKPSTEKRFSFPNWALEKKKDLWGIIDRTLEQLCSPNDQFSGLFLPRPILAIAAGERCSFGCGHCYGNCTSEGIDLDYNQFTALPDDFFSVFSVVQFGILGDPLDYRNAEKDIVDLLDHLNAKGLTKVTFSLPNYTKINPTIEKLYRFVDQVGHRLQAVQLSYHLYNEIRGCDPL